LSGLSCSLFDFIQVAMASTHSVTCDESDIINKCKNFSIYKR